MNDHLRPAGALLSAPPWAPAEARAGACPRAAVWVRLSALLVAATLANASLSAAAAPDPLDARVDRLAQELRCVVCQNQSVADSPAGIADDLKAHVRERLAAGASDHQVRAELVERYGEFVLYRPPLRGGTALLWFGPALLAAAGAVLLARLALRRGPLVNGPADTDTDTDTGTATATATATAGATCADTTTGAAAEHAATGASA